MTFTATTDPILGMYETGGNFPTPGPSAWPSGPTTNLAALYMAWGQDIPTYIEPFVGDCNSNGLVPYVELEPWNSGPSWDVTPLFSDITGGTWDSWLEAIGTFIASTGKPCILTFAHEMNVSGQYPWSNGDTGSGPGGGALTAAEWIAGWTYVRNKINSTAGGYALWMWACSAYTGGTTVSPAPWWPSSALPDLVGIDGYPSTRWGTTLGTFSGQLQPTVTIIRGLGWSNPIFISETNLAAMADGGTDNTVTPPVTYGPGQDITSFVADMYAAGVSGILEFEDATWDLPQMSNTQWSEYNTAVTANYGGGGGGGGSGTGPYTLFSQASESLTGPGAYESSAGLELTVSEACTLDGIWLYSPPGESLTALPTEIALYEVSGSSLVTSQAPSWSGAAGSGWVYAAFSSPPALAAGTDYMAVIFGPAASFGYSSGYSWPVTSGPLTGVSGGWYATGSSLAYPASQESGWNWWIDVQVTPPGSAGSPPPGLLTASIV